LSSSGRLEHKAYWTLKFFNFDHTTSGERRKLQLHQLDELRFHAYESSRLYKERMKLYHDKKLAKKNFQPGQYVLLLNSRLRLFPSKLKSKWYVRFTVKEIKPYGAVEIEDPVKNESWVVNGQRLKLYLSGDVERLTTIMDLKEA
jgi:hypothetical protein